MSLSVRVMLTDHSGELLLHAPLCWVSFDFGVLGWGCIFVGFDLGRNWQVGI